MPTFAEDATYYFDENAADAPCRFFERFYKLESGANFVLQPVQRLILRNLYGYRHRITHERKTNEMFWLAAVGAGKSPMLAGIGLYELMTRGRGFQILNFAATFKQARVIFDCARSFIDQEPELEKRLHHTQYEITFRDKKKRTSWWRIISGKAKVAGLRPGLVLFDEVHEAGSFRKTYDALQGRLAKTLNSLMICATNAGDTKHSLCHQLYERAVAALKDPDTAPPEFFPIVWESHSERIDDPARRACRA